MQSRLLDAYHYCGNCVCGALSVENYLALVTLLFIVFQIVFMGGDVSKAFRKSLWGSEVMLFNVGMFAMFGWFLVSLWNDKKKHIELIHAAMGVFIVYATVFSKSKSVLLYSIVTLVFILMMRKCYSECPITLVEEKKQNDFIRKVNETFHINWDIAFPALATIAAIRLHRRM
mgnify:CR=1 FL=1